LPSIVLAYEGAVLFGLPISFGSLLVVESARGEVVQALGLVLWRS
jgi:hypothetical protein